MNLDTRNSIEIGHPSPEAGGVAPSLVMDFLPLRLVLQGTSYVVEVSQSPAVLGRHTRCDVRLPFPDISRQHCSFAYENGAWFVNDLQSLNGIFVNGVRVAQSRLNDRDVLGIG